MISIIVPIYNCRNYIHRCIDSILKQDIGDLELILVDDGSTDGSGELCDELAEFCHQIHVIHQPNAGVSSARNAGMDMAKGEFIAFVDGDDWLPEQGLRDLVNAADESADLYMGSVLLLGTSQEPRYLYLKEKSITPDIAVKEMVSFDPTGSVMSGVWGKIFKSSVIRRNNIRFDENLKNGEDGFFILDYLSCIDRIVNLIHRPPVYYLYRYDVTERMNTVSFVYPDFYQFYVQHAQRCYDMMQKEKKALDIFYQRYINSVIIYLVRAYAYEDFFEEGELKRDLGIIAAMPLTYQAIRRYKRYNPSNSRIIPIAIRNRWVGLLEKELKKRAARFLRKKGKSEYIRSIYRGKQAE